MQLIKTTQIIISEHKFYSCCKKNMKSEYAVTYRNKMRTKAMRNDAVSDEDFRGASAKQFVLNVTF